MIQRCTNPNATKFAEYGGRGIAICDRWRNSFEAFLADMGERPGSGFSIDRIDNDGNYEPGNCRWATDDIQSTNKRNNHLIEHDGVRLTLSEWARKIGVHRHTISNRLNAGLPIDQVLAPGVAR